MQSDVNIVKITSEAMQKEFRGKRPHFNNH